MHSTRWFNNLTIEAVTEHYQKDTEMYVHGEKNASISQSCLRHSKEMYNIERERRRGVEMEPRKNKERTGQEEIERKKQRNYF